MIEKKEYPRTVFTSATMLIAIPFFAVVLWGNNLLPTQNRAVASVSRVSTANGVANSNSGITKVNPSPLDLENDLALVKTCIIFETNSPLLSNANYKNNCRRAGKEYVTIANHERSLSKTLPSALVNLAVLSSQTSSTLTVNGKPFSSNGHFAIPEGSIIGGKGSLSNVSSLTVPSGVRLYIADKGNVLFQVCASAPTPDKLYYWTINETANDSSGGLHLGLPCKPLS